MKNKIGNKIKNILGNKYTYVALGIILSFISILSIFLFLAAKDKNSVVIYANKTDIYIDKIVIGETNYPLKQFVDYKNTFYKDNKLILKKGTKFKKNYSNILNFSVSLSSKEKSSASVKINDSEKNIRTDKKVFVFSETKSLRNVMISFLKNMKLSMILGSIAIFIFLSIVYYFIFKYLYLFYNKVYNDSLKIKDVILFQLCVVFICFFCLYILVKVLNIYILLPFLIAILLPILGLSKKIINRIASIFVILVTVFGIFMAFVLPPFEVPDEATHFFKAYTIFSKDNVTYKEGYRTERASLKLSKNVGEVIDKYNMDIFNSNYTITAKEYFSDLHEREDTNLEKEIFFFGNTMDLPNFCYYPAAIISFVGLKLNLPFIMLPLLCRLINLLIFTICGYLTLQILPKFKKVFLATMLLPITIQQAIGINQDSITNSLFFITAAILISMIFDKNKIKNYKAFILILLSVTLGFCKTGYFAILFLILFIPKEKFENKKFATLFKIAIIVPCLFLSFSKYFSVATATQNSEVSFYSIKDIFREPLLIFSVCKNTIMNRLHFDLLTGLVDGFGWSTVWHKPLIQFMVSIVYFILIITAVDKKEKLNLKHRLGILLIALIIFGLIYASLLFGWTNYGANTIDGLQCRYFIPVALLLYLGISNNYIKLNFKNNNLVFVIGIVIVNILSFYTIISSFYV